MKIFVLGMFGFLAQKQTAASMMNDFTAVLPDNGDWISQADFEATVISLVPEDNGSPSYVALKDGIVSSTFQNLPSIKPLGRGLAQGDFDELFELIRNVVILLPDFKANSRGAFSISKELGVTNILCHDIVLNDIDINHNRESDQKTEFNVKMQDLGLTCEMDYKWKFGIFEGKGHAMVRTSGSSAFTQLGFSSKNFNFYPPESTVTEYCETDITISELDFTGSITADIMEWFDDVIARRLEEEIADTVCDEFTSLSTTLVGDMVKLARSNLAQYSQSIAPETSEQLIYTTDEVNIADFSNKTKTEKLLLDLISEANFFFGTWFSSEKGPGGRDLGINIFLRDNLLDLKQALEFTVEDLPFDFDPVLFEEHDRITETRIMLNKIEILGLDKFTNFEAAEIITNNTFQHRLNWDSLEMKAYLTVHIKLSTRDDSILYHPEPMEIFENITIDFGLDNIDTTVAFMLAIDQDILNEIRLGSLLFSKNILPCLFSTLHDVKMSTFSVQVRNIREPILEGFVSPGIDRVVTQSVEAAFSMYESVIIQSMPSIFQRTVRNSVNDFLKRKIAGSRCPFVKTVDEIIDFRDLFLTANNSAALGGFGDEPYGDIAGNIFEFLRDQFNSTDEDGLLQLNSAIIRPLTKIQSGVEGTIQYEKEFLSIAEDNLPLEFLERFEFSLSNARVQNLDTAVYPMDINIFQPNDQPHSLSNRLSLGPIDGRPLTATMTMNLDFVSKNSSFPMHNEIDFTIAMDSFQASADIIAMMRSSNLLNFPVKDLSNFQCWLATIPDGTNGATTQGNFSQNRISFESFASSISGLFIDMRCRNCTNEGLSIAKELTEILDITGTTNTVGHRLGFLIKEIMLSDAIQNIMNRLLLDAPKLCPHNPSFNSTAVENYHFEDQLLTLSAESLDTLLFATVALLQVGFIFLTETNQYFSVKPNDPLSIQKEYNAPAGASLLDFTNLDDDSLSPAFKLVFEEGRNRLNSKKSVRSLQMLNSNSLHDPINTTMDYAINAIMDQFLENDGYLNLPVDDLQYTSAGIKFQFNSARIAGLDSFTNFNLMNAISPQTLQNHFHLKTLSIEVDFSIDSIQTTAPPQHLTLFLETDDVEVNVPLFIAMDLDLFNQLELGSLLYTIDLLPCVLSTVTDFQIPQMSMSVGEIREPKIQGLAPETGTILLNLTKTLYESYDGEIKQRLSSVTNDIVRPILNEMLASFIADSTCKNTLAPGSQEPKNGTFPTIDKKIIDFRDLLLPATEAASFGGSGNSPYGDLFRQGYSMLNKLVSEVDPITGLSKVNEVFIGPITRMQSGETGTFLFSDELMDTSTRIDVKEFGGSVKLKITDISIKNVDNIGSSLSLMNALFQESYELNNTATLGVSETPLRFSYRILIAFSQDDGIQLSNDVKITLNLYDAAVIFTSFIKILEDRFATFPIGDILNIYCWLATIPAPALDKHGVRLKGIDPSATITNLAISLSQLKLEVECISCSSPGISELAELLSTPEAASELNISANQLMKDAIDKLIFGSSFVQMYIDQILNDAPLKCPHSSTYESNPVTTTYKPFISEGINDTTSQKVLFQIVTVTTFLLAFVAGFIFLVRYFVNHRHGKWLASLPKRRLFMLKQLEHENDGKELDLNTMTKSMFQSSSIPVFWRYMIPIILIGNLAFFLSGHLSLGATISIKGQIAGEAFVVENFYNFSMLQSTIDIWAAGGKSLALLILIFSGIWPYSKTIITLVLWFLSPTKVSVSRRGAILLWLDALAKWSMVDIFALIISIAAFRISIISPDAAYLPKDFYLIDLMVVPLWGLYANMIAQLISQLSSHLIIHYHRKVVRDTTRQYERLHGEGTDTDIGNILYTNNFIVTDSNGRVYQSLEQQRDILSKQAFSTPHEGENDKLVIRSYVNYLFCSAATSIVVLLCLGCYYPSFSMEILGILGIAVESGQHFEEAITNHSLFSTIKLLAEEASLLNNVSHYFGLGTLISICFMCVFIVPLVQVMVLMYQWFFLMTKKTRTNLSIFLEILQAWQYSEVYIISIITATWQLGPISDFMINVYCDSFSERFAMMDFFDLLGDRDVQCFRVEATIKSYTYFIAISAILLAVMNAFVMKAIRQYLNDSNHAVNRAPPLGKKVEFMLLDYDEERWDNAIEDVNSQKIPPPPILFTDTFSWLLRREDVNSAMQNAPLLDEEQTIMEEISNDFDDQEQFSNGRSTNAPEKQLTENSESTFVSVASSTKIEVLPSYYSDTEVENDNDTVEVDDATAITYKDDNDVSDSDDKLENEYETTQGGGRKIGDGESK